MNSNAFAHLTADQKKLKDLVANLEFQLASSKRSTVVDNLGAAVPSGLETDALVRLQEENQNLTAQLQGEATYRQAGDAKLKTLEAAVKSLDARLTLVNTERDNLARMLYDAKRKSGQ